jgi:hypothetical protein
MQMFSRMERMTCLRILHQCFNILLITLKLGMKIGFKSTSMELLKLRQHGLKISRTTGEQASQIEWDAKLLEWKTQLESLQRSVEDEGEEDAREIASDDDTDMGGGSTAQDALDGIV